MYHCKILIIKVKNKVKQNKTKKQVSISKMCNEKAPHNFLFEELEGLSVMGFDKHQVSWHNGKSHLLFLF